MKQIHSMFHIVPVNSCKTALIHHKDLTACFALSHLVGNSSYSLAPLSLCLFSMSASSEWSETAQCLFLFTVGSHTPTDIAVCNSLLILNPTCKYWILCKFMFSQTCVIFLTRNKRWKKGNEDKPVTLFKLFCSSFNYNPQCSWWSNCWRLIHLQRMCTVHHIKCTPRHLRYALEANQFEVK